MIINLYLLTPCNLDFYDICIYQIKFLLQANNIHLQSRDFEHDPILIKAKFWPHLTLIILCINLILI